MSEVVGTMVSEYDKEKKLEKRRANYKKQLSEESAEKKQERLAKMRASYNKRCSEETAEKTKACKKESEL